MLIHCYLENNRHQDIQTKQTELYMKQYKIRFDSAKKISLYDPSRNTYMEDLIVYNLTTPTDVVHKTVVAIIWRIWVT